MSFPDHVNPLHGALKFAGFRAGVLRGRDDQVTKIDHTTILFGYCQLQRWIAHFIPFPEIRIQVIEDNGAVTKNIYTGLNNYIEEVDNIGKVRGNKCMEVGKQFLRCRYFLKTTHKWNHLIKALWLGNHSCPPVRHHYYATAVQLMVSSFDTALA